LKNYSRSFTLVFAYLLSTALAVFAPGQVPASEARLPIVQSESHRSCAQSGKPSRGTKNRKKRSKKRRKDQPMPGMEMGEKEPPSSQQSMAGMDTGKKEPPSSQQSMPGMEMSKPGPASKAPEPAMPGMQMGQPGAGGQMAGMDHGAMGMEEPHSFIEAITHHNSSGTSAEPNSTPHEMIMQMRGNWMLMFHGVGFLTSNQQSGPRGRDKLFSTNWIMPMAQRQFGKGTLTLRTMLSLEPATVTGRRFPVLFQVGETAFGKPIVDGQHPHDFFMELAILYDLKVGGDSLISFYAAPVGDPAMGPTAYPHRVSASENPLPTLGHHMEDSTHIADDVLTVGFIYRIARLEASGFHGREPDEYRWDLDSGRIDSWSSRLTVSPSANWSIQYSIGRLKSPEQLNPQQDVLRMTASIMYNRPLTNGNWANTLLWGRNRSSPQHEVSSGYLAESTLQLRSRNYFWGRVENVDRTNELLLGENVEPPGFHEHALARIQAYSAGYDHEFEIIPHLATALGGQITFYETPALLNSIYGSHPRGVALFLRLRPGK